MLNFYNRTSLFVVNNDINGVQSEENTTSEEVRSTEFVQNHCEFKYVENQNKLHDLFLNNYSSHNDNNVQLEHELNNNFVESFNAIKNSHSYNECNKDITENPVR